MMLLKIGKMVELVFQLHMPINDVGKNWRKKKLTSFNCPRRPYVGDVDLGLIGFVSGPDNLLCLMHQQVKKTKMMAMIIPIVLAMAVSHLRKFSISLARHHGWFPLFHSNRYLVGSL